MTTRNKRKIATAASEAPAGKNGHSLISDEKLLSLYAAMLKCRLIEERARVLFPQNGFAVNGYAAAGQEAAAVGVAIDLLAEDTVAALGREFIFSFIRGAPLERIIGQIIAPAGGLDKAGFQTERSEDAAPGITSSRAIAGLLNIAIGVALANKTKKNGKIAVVFSGDGATSLEVWREALLVAGANQLPMIFVSLNSLAAEPESSKPRARGEKIAVKAEELGLPTIPVDGNDVVAVYRVASEAISRARQGRPTLIECVPFEARSPARGGNAEASKPATSERRTADDSILNIELYLTRKGLFSEELKQRIAAEFGKQLDAAIEIAEKTIVE
jgi:acetoin:2,6-dichlorophenolindophenol oxidoreductase subunit alpha